MMDTNTTQNRHAPAGAPFPEADYVRAMDAVLAQPEVKFINAFVGIAKDIARWHSNR